MGARYRVREKDWSRVYAEDLDYMAAQKMWGSLKTAKAALVEPMSVQKPHTLRRAEQLAKTVAVIEPEVSGPEKLELTSAIPRVMVSEAVVVSVPYGTRLTVNGHAEDLPCPVSAGDHVQAVGDDGDLQAAPEQQPGDDADDEDFADDLMSSAIGANVGLTDEEIAKAEAELDGEP